MIHRRMLPNLLLTALLVLSQAVMTAHAVKHTAPDTGTACLLCLHHVPSGTPAPLAGVVSRPPALVSTVLPIAPAPLPLAHPRNAHPPRAPPRDSVSI